MKKGRKLLKRKAARIARHQAKMNDPRISSIYKHSSNPPGSGKKS